MNTFGSKWSFTSFGESHGAAIGGVLDGVPAGITIDMNLIRTELDKRAGRAKHGLEQDLSKTQVRVSVRAKNEPDEVEWLSGVLNGVTLGTPIAFLIRNKDARPEDYEYLKHTYRVGHADKVYEQKYGIRDYRGGGRASARETAARVVAGCLAKQELATKGVCINARLIQVGTETDPAKFHRCLPTRRRLHRRHHRVPHQRLTGRDRRTDIQQAASRTGLRGNVHQCLQRI